MPRFTLPRLWVEWITFPQSAYLRAFRIDFQFTVKFFGKCAFVRNTLCSSISLCFGFAFRSHRIMKLKNALEHRVRPVLVCCLPVCIHINAKAHNIMTSVLSSSSGAVLWLHTFVDSRRFTFFRFYLFSTRSTQTHTHHAICQESNLYFSFLSFFLTVHTQIAQLHKKNEFYRLCTVLQSIRQSGWIEWWGARILPNK